MTDEYLLRSRRTDHVKRCGLALYPEVNFAAFSDEYIEGEDDPRDVWRDWLRYLVRGERWDERGEGWLSIYWSVVADPDPSGFGSEAAPRRFQPDAAFLPNSDVLDDYAWPEHAETGEPVNWLALPVVDEKAWFIYQTLNWRPAPFQSWVHIPSLAEAAGVPIPR